MSDLDHDFGRFASRGSHSGQPVRQRQAVHEARCDIDSIVLATDFMHADDVWMSKLRGCFRFPQKLFGFLRCQLALARHLDRDGTIKRLVERSKHRSEGTHTDLFDEIEVAESPAKNFISTT